ncbi:DUF4394 domain-containing protein [Panacagrimonas sp.]|uniref:DUF4394 domain-containing protein n=1 Tax=Panacagrimonas sp. TaxID=2480088 RepID=UPI003B5242F9
MGDNEDNLRIAFTDATNYTIGAGPTLGMSDTTLTPARNVGFAAYTNSFGRSGGDFLNTSLYVLDAQRNVLQTQGSVDSAPISPNSGRLTDVGALGVSFNDRGGFDIEGNAGVALATLNVDNATNSRLYSINLRSGAASCLTDLDLPGAQWAIGLAIPNGNGPDVFAVRGGNQLVTFTINSPGDSVLPVGMIPLNGGESVVGLDFRPATDELFALTNSGRLLPVSPVDASATEINANVASAATPPLLAGARFGVDFNPAADALRIVSDLAQNLRVPTNLALPAIVDGTLGYRQGVTAAGYTNPDPGATGTELFVIDTQNDRLFLQNPPNEGILVGRGLLGVGDVSSVNGHDVVRDGTVNEHYALLTVAPGNTNLYTINPVDGAATPVGMTLAAGLYKGLTVELGVALGARDLTLLREDAAGDVLVSATLMTGVLTVGADAPSPGSIWVIG